MTTHSEKALQTLSLLGLAPVNCGLIPIKWEKRKIEVPTKVDCPTCHRIGQAHFEANGKLAINKVNSAKDYYKWQDRERVIRALRTDRCPTCPAKRNHWGSSYGTGEITKLVLREVMVGTLLLEPGSEWDSRFYGWDHCHLCNKVITKSNRVPIHGKDAKGNVHNLWVGEDCALKFGGVEKRFPRDHFLAENLE